jgi:3-dehydro-L-gulonate 2-dehydrogenase
MSTTSPSNLVRVAFEELTRVLEQKLIAAGIPKERASVLASIFATNDLEGISSHGINRFGRFLRSIQRGFVQPAAAPTLTSATGALEQWDGNLGPGPIVATACTERAVALAGISGIGCVAVGNSNHWMRGGTYAWQATRQGCAFIGWSNTIANMPAWGAVDRRLGNNPFVLGVPYAGEAIVLDMAASQFSYGALEIHRQRNKPLPVAGGFDAHGTLTTDAGAILETGRVLPAGLWKGAGLALLLDILSAILSGGSSTAGITHRGTEYGLSQVFVAIDLKKLGNNPAIAGAIDSIIRDFHLSVPGPGAGAVLYPGERVLRTRSENLVRGIPLDRATWESIQNL